METICCAHFRFYGEKFLVSNFWDFVYWNSSIFWCFCQYSVSVKFGLWLNKKYSKFIPGWNIGHLLLKNLNDSTEIQYLWKRSNNGRIPENKVPKITNKKIFSIKSKMGTAYGFHIDLKFQADLPWLSGLQMAQAPRIARLGPAPTRMFESGIFHFLMVFYEYLQLWKVVDLKYLQLCVKKPP